MGGGVVLADWIGRLQVEEHNNEVEGEGVMSLCPGIRSVKVINYLISVWTGLGCEGDEDRALFVYTVSSSVWKKKVQGGRKSIKREGTSSGPWQHDQ